ncbi:MAG: hypothetical protein RDU83_13215 [bacterium]|nr:hypothetical protein [bacterium]
MLHFGPMYFRAVVVEDPIFFLRPSFLTFVLGSFCRNYGFAPPQPMDEVRADLALVHGEFHSQKLQVLNGYSPSQVLVVGAVDSDEMLVALSSPSHKLRRQSWLLARGLDPSRPTLTYIAQPLVEDGFVSRRRFQAFLRDLAQEASSHGFNLLAKAHPRSSGRAFDSLAHHSCFFAGTDSLADSILYSDVVLGHTSTALGLAVAVRKPLLVWPYVTHGEFEAEVTQQLLEVARPVRSRDELACALRELVSPDWEADHKLYENWLRKYYYFDPTRGAGERIAEILIAVCADGIEMTLYGSQEPTDVGKSASMGTELQPT